MFESHFFNKRITSRNILNIEGILTVKNETGNTFYTEDIHINNFSLKGIQFVFSNNDLLFFLLDFKNDSKTKINIQMTLYEEQYVFECNIDWMRIYNIGERHFYVLIGACYTSESFPGIKDNIVELLVSMNMENGIKSKIELINNNK